MDSASSVSRSILWMEARKNKSGGYYEKAQSVIDKLHHYMEQEASGELTTSGQKDLLALALGKPEHSGRVRGVGQDIPISKYWPRTSKGASSSKVNASKEAVISELKDQMKVMESTFGAKIQALELVIDKLIADKQPLKDGHPHEELHLMSTPMPEVPCPQSGKASCSALKNLTNASKESGWQSCELFWPDLTQAVARGKLYSSSSGPGVLHTMPLKSGCVKVAVVTLIKGDAMVPHPTDEVHTIREAIGQFIAWPKSLVKPIESSEHPEKELLKGKSKAKSLTYESVIGPSETESEPSTLDKYQWILDEFNGTTLRKIKVHAGTFHYDHPGLEIGNEEIQRWLDRKEIGTTHVILYVRYLYDNHCNCVNNMFQFLCPTQISPLAQSIEQRATYIANTMEGDVMNKIFIAPYHFRYHSVLILMNPQLGYAYWIDPRHGKVEKDAESLVALSYKLKFAKLNRRTPRKQTLWHVIKCPRQRNVTDCGYYILNFMRDLVIRQKSSSVIPVNWYDDKTVYSHEDIDEVRRNWLDYILSLL